MQQIFSVGKLCLVQTMKVNSSGSSLHVIATYDIEHVSAKSAITKTGSSMRCYADNGSLTNETTASHDLGLERPGICADSWK